MTSGVQAFTAYVSCPSCRTVDVHWLDEKPIHPPPDWEPEYDEVEVRVFQEREPQVRRYARNSPYDHPDACVIRRCRRCQKRWGQR